MAINKAEMPSWRPDESILSRVIELIRQGLSPSNANNQEVQEMITRYSQESDFCRYCAFVCVLGESCGCSLDIRQAAGILCKNALRMIASRIDTNVLEYIRAAFLKALEENVKQIARTASIAISTIVRITRLETWPQLVQHLCQVIQNHGTIPAQTIEAHLCVLQFIAEDDTVGLIDESNKIGQPLYHLIPKLIELVGHTSDDIRFRSLSILIQFIRPYPNALDLHLQAFQAGIAQRVSDTDHRVRKLVCESLVQLTEVSLKSIVPHIESIASFMLTAMEDSEPTVALAATEFWTTYAEHTMNVDTTYFEAIVPFFPRVLPILLKNMRYNDDELMDLPSIGEQDANIPDPPEDIRPLVRNRLKKSDTMEDEDDGDTSQSVSQWTLRKCSANTVDDLACAYGDAVLNPLLKELPSLLSTEGDSYEAWMRRDIGVLTLGAVSEGCFDDLIGELPNLVPYLVRLTKDTVPAIRAVSVWALARFASFIVQSDAPEYGIRTVLAAILSTMLDSTKHVQAFAITAFGDFAEEGTDTLIPFISDIVKVMEEGLAHYQAKSLMLLYDAIAKIAESNPELVTQPLFIERITSTLGQNFLTISMSDLRLTPLMECLSVLLPSIGDKIASQSHTLCQHCGTIIESQLVILQDIRQKNKPEDGQQEVITGALDVLGGIAQALENGFEPLVQPCNILPRLLLCCQENDHEIRQSGFACLGEITKSSFVHIQANGYLDKFIQCAIDSLAVDHFFLGNNSCWALGEMVLHMESTQVAAIVPHMLQKLEPVLDNLKAQPPLLLENIGITIGRMAIKSESIVAKTLGHRFTPWLQTIALVTDFDEKTSAFTGFIRIANAHPTMIVQNFPAVCFAIGSWFIKDNTPRPTQEMFSYFQTILQHVHQTLGDNNWRQILQNLPHDVRTILVKTFQSIL